MESTDEGSTDEESTDEDVNKALTELGRVVMTLRPKGADKPQTKEAVLDMAVDVLTHLEKKVRDRNLNPAALPLNRESEISDDYLDEQEATEPDQVPQSVGYQGQCVLPSADGHPGQIRYHCISAGGHAAGPFPPGLRDRTYDSPLSPALGASPRPPALETSPIFPALGASATYPVFVPSTLSPALGASSRPPALVASTLSPALGASPRSANQNESNPISYEDQKFLEDLSESREASFDILGWPQKVMGYLSSLIQSDETGKSAEKID